MGRDFTIFAVQEGYVAYEWAPRGRRRVSVHPEKV
jgi:ribosomal protein L27